MEENFECYLNDCMSLHVLCRFFSIPFVLDTTGGYTNIKTFRGIQVSIKNEKENRR